MRDVPIYINVRDRVTCLRKLVTWLEQAGQQNIILLDNDSTYEPLLEYLGKTPHEVVYFKTNLGARSLWQYKIPRGWYVFTDPDVIPIEECPLDAVQHFRNLLDKHPQYPKAGFGLYTGDVPAHMPFLFHERSLMDVRKQVSPNVFDSAIDTTFALYRGGTGFDYTGLRTGSPYLARHTCISWYGTTPTDEDRYYFEHADKGSEGSSGARRVALG